MKVLLLSPYPEKLHISFASTGDAVRATTEPLIGMPETDFIVSYGYRHIIREPLISSFAGRMINMHISMLPWNRGADPNFWSWFDETPKGVSIHNVDTGIDTGDMLAQREVNFSENETLSTTYAKLHEAAVMLFAETWPLIRRGLLTPKRQEGTGSHHKTKDKEFWWRKFPLGHDTPVKDIEAIGHAHRQ